MFQLSHSLHTFTFCFYQFEFGSFPQRTWCIREPNFCRSRWILPKFCKRFTLCFFSDCFRHPSPTFLIINLLLYAWHTVNDVILFWFGRKSLKLLYNQLQAFLLSLFIAELSGGGSELNCSSKFKIFSIPLAHNEKITVRNDFHSKTVWYM